MTTTASSSAGTERRRSNHMSAFAVGIVLLVGAGWYYLSARSASENLARNSFRQLNNLAEQADAVMVNFQYLFKFLPVAANASALPAGGPLDASSCTPGALADHTSAGEGLARYLECQLLAGAGRSSKDARAVRESLATMAMVRKDHRDNEIRYRRSLQATRVLAKLSLRWVAFPDSACAAKSGDNPRDTSFRLQGPAGNQELVVTDCPDDGKAPRDGQRLPSARLPFGSLFDPVGLNFDFDQFAVLDADGNLLFLSTDRLGNGRHNFGRLPETSEFTRLLKLDLSKSPTPAAGKAPASAPNEKDRYTQILSRRFGDTDYTVFVQPHVPTLQPADGAAGYASWYVVGLKETRRFNSERFHVAPLKFAVFTFALILAIALLPAVRLLFLGRGTSLSRFDFSLLVVGLIVATGSAVILGLILYSSGRLAHDSEVILEALASQLKRALVTELTTKVAALEAAEERIIASYQPLPAPLGALLDEARALDASSPLYRALAARFPNLRFDGARDALSRSDVAALKYLAGTEPLYTDLKSQLLAAPARVAELPAILALQRRAHVYYDGLLALDAHNVDPACANPTAAYALGVADPDLRRLPVGADYALAWLIDENGDQVFGPLNNRRGQLRHFNVQTREYFKLARDRQVWRPDWAGQKGVIVERVWSRSEGRKTTIVAQPVARDPATLPAALRGCAPRVAALSTSMPALTAAVLPANYHFAVINDQSGAVLFHASDEAALIENFYTETGNDRALLAATQRDRDAHFRSFYSDRWIDGFVTPVAGVPWSVVVYHDGEMAASIIFESAVIAFIPVLVIALLVLLGMELQHWMGYTIANAWWPHPDNALRHALTAAISIAYAIALFRNLRNADGAALVTQPMLIGPLLFAYLSTLWADASLRNALLVIIPLVGLTWGLMLDGVEFALLALVLASVIILLSRVTGIAQALRPAFRTVHALAGIGLFTAVAGVPVFGFYQDAVGYYLTRQADFATSWAVQQQHSRANVQADYCRQTLRDSPALLGECAKPTSYGLAPAEVAPPPSRPANASEAPCDYDPTASFAHAVADSLVRRLEPYSDENAMLRPPHVATGAKATLQCRPDVSRHIGLAGKLLILCCTSLFLGLVSWLASRRLFGLQSAGSYSFLPSWPLAPNASGERPDITQLSSPSLLVGYSPGPLEMAQWRATHTVCAWDALDAAALPTGPLVVTTIEMALRDSDVERAARCRAALRQLVERGGALVMVCEVLPDFAIPDAVANGVGHLAGDTSAHHAWLEIFDHCARYGAPARWKGGVTRPHPVDDELSTFPELQIQAGAIKAHSAGAERPVQFLAVVFRAAESVYFRKWHASTLREQALLLQLVRRELVNPDQHDVLESLLNRGLIVREPRVRIASRTFHWFVENVEITRELDQFSARYQDSVWQSMRWPVIMVLGLFALFLFQSGDDKMQWVIALLGSVITLSSTVRQLWSLVTGGAGGSNGAAAK